MLLLMLLPCPTVAESSKGSCRSRHHKYSFFWQSLKSSFQASAYLSRCCEGQYGTHAQHENECAPHLALVSTKHETSWCNRSARLQAVPASITVLQSLPSIGSRLITRSPGMTISERRAFQPPIA
jgi:hypothetical protein